MNIITLIIYIAILLWITGPTLIQVYYLLRGYIRLHKDTVIILIHKFLKMLIGSLLLSLFVVQLGHFICPLFGVDNIFLSYPTLIVLPNIYFLLKVYYDDK